MKEHFKKHKTAYLIAGAAVGGAVLGVVGYLILTKNGQLVINESFQMKLIDRSVHNNTVITELVRQGHPGNKVRCVETGVVYPSQNVAAKATGVNPGNLSNHLSGRQGSVGGLHFENLGEMM